MEARMEACMEMGALVRLLQLSSPTLPVGAYSYSQGLESALASGVIGTVAQVEAWMGDHLLLVLARNDLAFGWRLCRAWAAGDVTEAARWDDEYVASRDGAELRAETLQMGHSLLQLSRALAQVAPALQRPSFLAAFTFLATHWRIPPRLALVGWTWSWLDSQLLAWLKTGEVGQQTAQGVLHRLGPRVPEAVLLAEQLADDAMDTWAPGLSLASHAHEVQEGRLFRS